ncbi:hypothetical protein SNEBB_010875 [Seison nebaliae]|nr:hypothetical protein SNEBB_010875 [Seison nebaliae]
MVPKSISIFLPFLLILIKEIVAVEYGNKTVTDLASFEIEVTDYPEKGEDLRGTLKIGLFGKTVPMTVLNFKSLTTGYQRGNQRKLWYKNTLIHRIVPDFVLQLGDVLKSDGTGSISIYGDKFVDENFFLSHGAPGILSMANHGKDTNGCQFFILLNKARWLDNKHVVFGKVLEGMDFLRELGEIPLSKQGTPKKKMKIIECEVNDVHRQFELNDEDYKSSEDVDISKYNIN